MSLYKAFAIFSALQTDDNRNSVFLTFGFCTASYVPLLLQNEFAAKMVNFNQNDRTELWNFLRFIIDAVCFSTRSYSRTPCGESSSITRREWQREIDQVISRQILL